MAYPQQTLLNFLSNLGVKTQSGKNGKIFIQGGAKKLRDVLVSNILSSGHSIYYNSEAKGLLYNAGQFCVKTTTATFTAPAILLCAGGKSYPQTGSNGSSYHLALGHHVSDLKPSLAPVTIKDFPLIASSGISFSNAAFRLKKIRETKSRLYGPGDLLITHKGFSGPLILNNSRDFSENDQLQICWNQELTQSVFEGIFTKLRADSPKRQLGSLYSDLKIPKNFFSQLMVILGCDPNLRIGDTSITIQTNLKQSLTAWTCQIDSPGDFRYSMSTAGGISLEEVDRKTLMSNIQPGLFFAGEYLDIDGDTGGYNLQAAFSTAWNAIDGALAYLNRTNKPV
jgi:predicted Rossmann fold flavoprotein